MKEDLTGLINGNHRRTISTVLGLLDRSLCQFRLWAEGYCAQSVLYLERNSLSIPQRQSVLALTDQAQDLIRELRDALELEEKPMDVQRCIIGQVGILRVDLMDIQSRRLRGYGDPAPTFAAYFDPKTEALIALLQRISAAITTPGGTHEDQ